LSAAAGLGFEPRLTDPESAVLPLDDPALDTRMIPNPAEGGNRGHGRAELARAYRDGRDWGAGGRARAGARGGERASALSPPRVRPGLRADAVWAVRV